MNKIRLVINNETKKNEKEKFFIKEGFTDKKNSRKYQIYYCWFHINKNRIIKI